MGGNWLKQWPGFGIGILGGALLMMLARPSGEVSKQPDVEEVTKRPAPRVRSEVPARKVTGSSTLAKLQEGPEGKRGIPEMKDADLQASIVAMLKEADPFKGFSYKEKSLFNAILDELAKRDADGALNWVDDQLSGTLRAYSYERLLEKRFGDDRPREAIDFFESRGFEQKEISNFAGKLLFSTKEIRAEDAIYLLQKNYGVGNSSSGSSVDYVDGFDFAAFADAAMRIDGQDRDHSMGFSRFPTNLFEEWVKATPHEAMEFYSEHYLGKDADTLSFNGIEDLAKGYLSTATREESEAWTTEILTNIEMPLRERKKLVGFLLDPGSKHGDLLAAAASSISDRAQAVEFSGMVLERSVSRSRHSYSDALSVFPDGESRLEGIERLAVKGGYASQALRQNSATLYEELGELGHGAADIQRIATALEKGN